MSIQRMHGLGCCAACMTCKEAEKTVPRGAHALSETFQGCAGVDQSCLMSCVCPPQEDIVQEAEVGAARKVFDLDLPELGPYNLAFTRSGAHLLLGGRKGHLALMDWQQRHLICEVQVPGPLPSAGLPSCNGHMQSCWLHACQRWPSCHALDGRDHC